VSVAVQSDLLTVSAPGAISYTKDEFVAPDCTGTPNRFNPSTGCSPPFFVSTLGEYFAVFPAPFTLPNSGSFTLMVTYSTSTCTQLTEIAYTATASATCIPVPCSQILGTSASVQTLCSTNGVPSLGSSPFGFYDAEILQGSSTDCSSPLSITIATDLNCIPGPTPSTSWQYFCDRGNNLLSKVTFSDSACTASKANVLNFLQCRSE
jgi:hypothetical protein